MTDRNKEISDKDDELRQYTLDHAEKLLALGKDPRALLQFAEIRNAMRTEFKKDGSVTAKFFVYIYAGVRTVVKIPFIVTKRLGKFVVGVGDDAKKMINNTIEKITKNWNETCKIEKDATFVTKVVNYAGKVVYTAASAPFVVASEVITFLLNLVNRGWDFMRDCWTDLNQEWETGKTYGVCHLQTVKQARIYTKKFKALSEKDRISALNEEIGLEDINMMIAILEGRDGEEEDEEETLKNVGKELIPAN